MTTSTSVIAYHDVEMVTAAHVGAAERAVADTTTGPVLHLHSADAEWRGGDAAHATVAAARSPELRSHLSEQLDALSTFARGHWTSRWGLRWRGIDLVSVARSTWFTELTPLVHRAWVCHQLLDERPQRLLWLTDDPAIGRSNFPHALQALARARGTRVDVIVDARPVRDLPRRNPIHAARTLLGAVRADLWRRAPERSCGAPTVLLVEAFPNHLPAPIAVAQELASRPGVRPLFAVADDRLLAAIPESLSAVRARQLASRRANLARHVLVWAAARSAHRLTRAVASGRGPSGASGALLEPGFGRATVTAFRRAGEVTPTAADAVHRLRPIAVASSTKAAPLVRAAVFAANQLGITTYFLQHGALVFSEEGRWDRVHDRFLVWGESDRRRMIEVGVPGEDIIVTGSLKFERFAERAASVPVPSVSDGEFTIVYLPSRSGGRMVSISNAEAMLRLVIDGIAAAGGAKLVVKVHPTDSSEIFDEVQGCAGVEVRRGGDPIELMASASVVIAATSTAGLEACAIGRPLVVLALPGVQLPDEYERHRCAVIVSDPEALADALRALRAGEPALLARLERGRRDLIADLFAGMAPGTASRCADAILDGVDVPPRSRPQEDVVGSA